MNLFEKTKSLICLIIAFTLALNPTLSVPAYAMSDPNHFEESDENSTPTISVQDAITLEESAIHAGGDWLASQSGALSAFANDDENSDVTAQRGSDGSLLPAVQQLIDAGEFTETDYDAFINSRVFEEIITEIKEDDFLQLIIDKGFLKDEITNVGQLKDRLKLKPGFEDIDEFKLTNLGWLTAINDQRGEGTLFKEDLFFHEGEPVHEWSITYHAVQQMKDDFEQNRSEFIDYLDEEGMLNVLGVSDGQGSVDAVDDPLQMTIWGDQPKAMIYDDEGKRILRTHQALAWYRWYDEENTEDLFGHTASINCKPFSVCDQDHIDRNIESLQNQPEDQRVVRITNPALYSDKRLRGPSTGGLPYDLDPLRDKNNSNRVVLRPPPLYESLLEDTISYQNIQNDGSTYSVFANPDEVRASKDGMTLKLNVVDRIIEKQESGVVTIFSFSSEPEEFQSMLWQLLELTREVRTAHVAENGWTRVGGDSTITVTNYVNKVIQETAADLLDTNFSRGSDTYETSVNDNIIEYRQVVDGIETTYQINTETQSMVMTKDGETFSYTNENWMDYRNQLHLLLGHVTKAQNRIIADVDFESLPLSDRYQYVILKAFYEKVRVQRDPYHYPSMEGWKELMREHLRPILQQYADNLEGGIRALHMDYENGAIDFSRMVRQFINYDENGDLIYDATPLTNHPDYEQDAIFENIGKGPFFSRTDIHYSGYKGVQHTRDYTLAFNAWAWNRRTEAFQDSVIDLFQEYFPEAKASQWMTNLRASDAVGYSGNYGNFKHLPGLGQVTAGMLHNTAVYAGSPTIARGSFVDFDYMGPANAEEVGNGSGKYFSIFSGALGMIERLNSLSAASEQEVSHYLTSLTYANEKNTSYGPDAYYDESCKCIKGGVSIGESYAEAYFRSAANSDTIQFWTSSERFRKSDKEFLERVIYEVNQLLGFENRQILYDASVIRNGKRVSVGPHHNIALQEDIAVWAAKGRGLQEGKEGNVYRVLLDTDKLGDGEDRWDAVLNDGTDGNPVKVQIGDTVVEIPGAQIFTPEAHVSTYDLFEVTSEGEPTVVKVLDDPMTFTNTKIISGGDVDGGPLVIEKKWQA